MGLGDPADLSRGSEDTLLQRWNTEVEMEQGLFYDLYSINGRC